MDHPQRFFLALDAIHRALHLGIEILDTQADAVEACFAEQRDGFIADLARIDLYGIFAVLHQLEMLADRRHHLADLVIAEEGRRAAAKVQLQVHLLVR